MIFPSVSLALLNLAGGQLFALCAMIAGLVLGGIIAISAMYMEYRRKILWHETARLALEKGQPIPSMQENASPRPPREKQSDIRKGLVLVAIGGGLYFFLGALVSSKMALAGAIPGFIGGALLLYGICTTVFSKKKSASDALPPQS